MIRIPKHQWEQIFIEGKERYACKKCGKIVTIEYVVNRLLYLNETCPETYVQEELQKYA